MILTIGGTKGGTGKSTLATNLAIIRAAAGADVLLIDADQKQETSVDFTALRNERRSGGAGYTCIALAGASVRTETLRLREKYSDIIIDTGAKDTASQRAALVVSDTVLVPFAPRSFDLWAGPAIEDMVSEVRTVNPSLRAYTIVNTADPRGSDNEEAAEMLRGSETLVYMPAQIGARKAFGNAAASGLAVTELPRSQYDPKAAAEIMALYALLFGPTSVAGNTLSAAGKA